MDYIDIENVRVGDCYRCGKAMLEVLEMTFTMQHFTVRIGKNPPIRLHARDLHALLNPAEESA